jgi:hypothetical protein
VTAHDVIIRGAGVLAVAGVLIGGGTDVVGGGGGGGEAVTANLFAVPPASADGTTTCVRSATLKTYADALTANAVCKGSTNYTSWEKACAAATGGDIVGVMPGAYAPAVPGQDWFLGGDLLGAGGDCSDGAGADYDPNYEEKGNAPASLTNWVTFVPGDTSGCPNISLTRPGNMGYGDWHLRFVGGCFNFNRTIVLNHGGSVSGEMSNIHFEGTSASDTMDMYGLEVKGCENCMFKHIDYGPNVQCAANDANATPAYFRCDPSGPYFEAPFATVGTNAPGCTPAVTPLCAGYYPGGSPAGNYEFVEPYFHQDSSGLYANLRLEDFHVHDGQAKGTGVGVHPGCFMFDGNQGAQGVAAHNFVMDNVSCERQVIGVQASDGGFTLQNSYLGCPVQDLAQTTGDWDNCSASYEWGIGCINQSPPNPTTTPGCTQQNVLIRYNVFFPVSGGTGVLANTTTSVGLQTSFGAYSNVRIIGNIFMSPLSGCGNAGITCANNSFWNVSTAGSSPTTLSCDPTVDSDHSNSNTWSETTLLDPRLSGASCSVPTLDPSSLGVDYQLGHTIDRGARSTTATRPGTDE